MPRARLDLLSMNGQWMISFCSLLGYQKVSDENMMTWSQIIERYGYDSMRETDYHPDGSHHGRTEQHELFHCASTGGGSEFEVTNFLNALVKLFKFRNVLETGAEQGHGTLALAEAVQYNGVGHVTTVDSCDIAERKTKEKLSECGLDKCVTYVKEWTTEWAKEYDGPPFDFAFFDCGHEARVEVFHTLYGKGKLSRVVSFHDVSHPQRENDPQAEKYCAALDLIASEYACQHGGLFNILSRGFRMFQLAL
ncbi:MAG: hypothetical protein CMB80_01235 [Flammeovirgaceae bacterium]|nr:hypothetical protein [Flammeovirgaceae bacterium]